MAGFTPSSSKAQCWIGVAVARSVVVRPRPKRTAFWVKGPFKNYRGESVG